MEVEHPKSTIFAVYTQPFIMKLALHILLLFAPILAFSQKMPEIDALNRVILNHKDSIIYAHLLPIEKSKKVHVSDAYWYNWYAQHDIKETKGGFDGKLLHGQYTEFYASKDLKKKGIIKNGLKTGKWKSWHKNGQLSEIWHYKNGLKHGKFIQFNEQGNYTSKGKYIKGKKKREKLSKEIKAEMKKAEKQKKKDDKIERGKSRSEDKIKKNKKEDNPITIDGESEIKNKKTKKEKTPKIRVQKGMKILTLPGKSI